MKPKYLYISEPVAQTIIESQVINWLELLQQNGILFDLITSNPLSFFIKGDKDYKRRKRRVKELLSGRVYFLPVLRKKDSFGITRVLLTIFLFYYFTTNAPLKSKFIVQTRNYQYFRILLMFKRIIPGIRIVFDVRGASAEEYINGMGITEVDNSVDDSIRKSYNVKVDRAIWTLKNSDLVFCVSEKLKSYLLTKSPGGYSEKVIVIPGAADSSHFRYDAGKRNELRERHNLTNEFVLLYSGRLDTPWQMKDMIFRSFKELLVSIPDIFFFCLTNDIQTARALKNKYAISDEKILISYVPYAEIPFYYSAADAGILLRENILTNNVASPTKVAEYLLCGLPVVASGFIGDYSRFIETNDLGVLVNNDPASVLHAVLNIRNSKTSQRDSISESALRFYSKQAYLETLVSAYQSLQSQDR